MRKLFAHNTADKRLISKIYKTLKKLDKINPTTLFKNGVRRRRYV